MPSSAALIFRDGGHGSRHESRAPNQVDKSCAVAYISSHTAPISTTTATKNNTSEPAPFGRGGLPFSTIFSPWRSVFAAAVHGEPCRPDDVGLAAAVGDPVVHVDQFAGHVQIRQRFADLERGFAAETIRTTASRLSRVPAYCIAVTTAPIPTGPDTMR